MTADLQAKAGARHGGANAFANTIEDSSAPEPVTPCFTPGTTIATPTGERAVEDLAPGDQVITRDNGIQTVRWSGKRDFSAAEIARSPHLQPVLLRRGALGDGLPERDMRLSPNHRMLVANDRTALYFSAHEVFVSAKHLINNKGVQTAGPGAVRYVHFMCDRHEAVLSNGAWSETFRPSDRTLQGMGNAQRTEILEVFPQLRDPSGAGGMAPARKELTGAEAGLLSD